VTLLLAFLPNNNNKWSENLDKRPYRRGTEVGQFNV